MSSHLEFINDSKQIYTSSIIFKLFKFNYLSNSCLFLEILILLIRRILLVIRQTFSNLFRKYKVGSFIQYCYYFFNLSEFF